MWLESRKLPSDRKNWKIKYLEWRIIMKLKYMIFVLLSVCMVFIAGCGGGGGSNTAPGQPTLVTIKLTTTGTLPVTTPATAIGGIKVTVTANPSTGLTIADADVTASGSGIGSTLVPNTTSVSNVVIALSSATGIQVGEFVTLRYHVAAGSFPAAGDFTVVLNGVVNDANIPAQAINGIGVAKLSVSIQ